MDKQKDVEADGKITVKGGKLQATSKFKILMSDYDIDIPGPVTGKYVRYSDHYRKLYPGTIKTINSGGQTKLIKTNRYEQNNLHTIDCLFCDLRQPTKFRRRTRTC